MIKHQDQKQYKEEFILSYGSREIRVHYDRAAEWQQAADMATGSRERMSPNASRKHRMEVGRKSDKVIYSQSSPLATYFLQQDLNLPKQWLQAVTILEPMGKISYSNHYILFPCLISS